jgi:Tol biopolymer transport system component
VADTPLPDDWSTLASLVDALLDAPPDQRTALIAELSAGDSGRRLALERLLVECEHEPSLFSRPAAERFATLFDDDMASFPEALADRYRLVRQLGRGGMATVYLARDLKHARDVAVKVVHPAVASTLGADRFLAEIRIMAQLNHRHIVPLYDSGEAGGSLYYVMPYEEGSSLRHRLARDGRLPLDDVVLILRDVCDALSHAHQRGIVHRDVKPDNVLLSGRRAMVTDFGVAKAATLAAAGAKATAAGVTLGTPAYMAPEQIAADPHVDHRADIYSTGAMAYELLTGRPPFDGDARQEVLSAHLTAVPAPVTSHRPDVPLPLAELVMQCLEKRPADRWQSADEMVHQLEALGRGAGGSMSGMRKRSRWTGRWAVGAGLAAAAALAVLAWKRSAAASPAWRDRWANARIERLTDFPGSEVDAAISANGHFVAFLADRDGVFDAYVSQLGSEQVVNLTGGRLPQLYNDDVRNIGFTADAAHVWMRVADITSPASVSLVPTMGGTVRPFLATAVMVAWSPDGARVAYHEAAPGDPIYVADADGGNARRVFVARPGVHNHYLSWSPDGRLVYFSQGLPPDDMDIWRIAADGSGPPERITRHSSRVAYPVLLDERTLFYTATADDGTGPWLYGMDVRDRVAHRVSTAVEHYISIAANADVAGRPRRLVATVSNPSVALWSVPITSGVADEQLVRRVVLPTARSSAPRFGPDSSLLYLASRGGADGLWRLSGARASELWKPGQGAVVGAAAASPDGRSVCFPVRRQGRSTLYCTAADGTAARAVAESLDVSGAASWSPDGKWLAVAARESLGVRVFKIPVAGGPPVRLVDSVSSNPVWSPDGRFILYSGTPRARSVPIQAVTPDGTPHPLPALAVDRIGDNYRFHPNGRELVVKLGGFRRQDFWLFDLATGRRRALTALRPGESLPRFDVSPDGKRILFERVRENSDVVLIELPPR